MSPNRPRPPRRSKATPCAEALESRALLTGGAGNTFALIPGTITQAGGSSQVAVQVDSAHFTLPKRGMSLGFDVVASGTSTLRPTLKGLTDAAGKRVARAPRHGPMLVTLRQTRGGLDKPETFHVDVKAAKGTSGAYLLGAYLAGDANGDGKVDPTDLAAIRAARGQTADQSSYSFDADTNRDGIINRRDLNLARRNLGASTNITPVLTANIAASTLSDPVNRVASQASTVYSGQGTPGASIVFSEVNNLVPSTSTTLGADGSYSITVPLAPGSNTFQVTSVDPFGQTITGQLSPVTYTPATS